MDFFHIRQKGASDIICVSLGTGVGIGLYIYLGFDFHYSVVDQNNVGKNMHEKLQHLMLDGGRHTSPRIFPTQKVRDEKQHKYFALRKYKTSGKTWQAIGGMNSESPTIHAHHQRC